MLALSGRGGRSGHPAPRRNLRARPQRARQSAPGPGAPDRRAGAGVQPRPWRRHRRTYAPCRSRAGWKARSGTSLTTNPSRPRNVVAYATALLGLPAPPEEPFDEARLSSMTAEFYADNKRVSIAKAKTILGFVPAYPTYREGLEPAASAGEGRGA